MQLCECKCGQKVSKEENKFIRGHNRKGKTKETDESVERGAEKHSKWMKNGGASFVASFRTEDSFQKQAEKMQGRTKETHVGVRRMAEKHLGNIPWNKELTKETDERLKKVSERMKNGGSTYAASFITEESRIRGGENRRGKNHGMWKGGISFEPYGLDFNNKLKKYIREKFNHTCIICESSAKIPHHIDYNKKNNQEDNFVLLCKKCHAKTNSNREHWKVRFRNSK